MAEMSPLSFNHYVTVSLRHRIEPVKRKLLREYVRWFWDTPEDQTMSENQTFDKLEKSKPMAE